MSDYSGPGIYGIVPNHAQDMSLDVWGGAKKEGTPIKLYKRDPKAKNHQFMIVDAGGFDAKAEKGDREYLIIAVNSGLYLTCNDVSNVVTTELRSPTDPSIRWKLSPAGNGSFYIIHVSGNKQINCRGAGKDAGTEVITYNLSTNPQSQFLIKLIG